MTTFGSGSNLPCDLYDNSNFIYATNGQNVMQISLLLCANMHTYII